ncbi:MAG: glycoside hydrolase family 127 protein [Clostridia bacterium]|nr:glycoside hydrolase family 127 protein [Clostridia bacterium]
MSIKRDNNLMRKFAQEKDFLFDGILFDADGIVDYTARFVQSHQLLRSDLWELFVRQFSLRVDGQDGGWRGEYWGKMMRGACMTYQYTRSEQLYSVLLSAVKGIMATQDSEGRITTYGKESEFSGWDMWCRKYVLLGLQHFYVICKDEALKKDITEIMKKHLDYIMSKIGEEDGKIDILQSTTNNEWTWGALNSSSILEPVVYMYNLTEEQKYLDFASYIIKRGGSSWGNVFELALEGTIPPYNYPVTKAYEMMSFFEGVVEYYRVTGDKDCKKAFLNFVNAVIDNDVTVIGSCGCTHELFDNSAVKQTEKSDTVMQETCVTVTLMKLCYQALRLTGDAKYASVIEKSYYNALLSSVNFNMSDELGVDESGNVLSNYVKSAEFVKKIRGFTFDSYAPLVKAKHNVRIGGYKEMDGGTSYGCCACIGSAGTALFPLSAVMYRDDGFAINHYVSGSFTAKTPQGQDVRVTIETDYPYGDRVRIVAEQSKPESYTVALRVPSYCNAIISDKRSDNTTVKFTAFADTYFENCDVHGTRVEYDIEFDTSLKLNSLNGKVSISKGAIVYAIDERNQNLDVVVTDKAVLAKQTGKQFECKDAVEVTFSNGERVNFVDYAHAGKDFKIKNRGVSVWLDFVNES